LKSIGHTIAAAQYQSYHDIDGWSILNSYRIERMSESIEPRKRGPKPLPQSDKRQPIGIPLSPTEADTIRAAASASGQPFTVFARDAMLAAAARVRRKMGPLSMR
jgi:hypothetical protein